MKKIISQICSISILATSLNLAPVSNAFGQGSNQTAVIRDVIANYTLSLERAEGSIKSMSEAAIALSEQGVTSQAILDYLLAGMEQGEAQAYKATIESRLDIADAENMPTLLKEVTEQMSKGSNFRRCSIITPGVTIVTGITAMVFLIATIEKSGSRSKKEDEIKTMRLEKTDLESDVQILIGEGVKPESFLIASIKKDIAYLDEQMSQTQQEKEKAAAQTKTYSIVAGATGAVSVLGLMNGCL